MFTEGFEKVAKLKHLALAGLIAASPMKAKADMVGSVGDAVRKSVEHTAPVKNATETVNKYLKKAQNVRLFGKSQEPATKATAAVAAKATKPGPSANLSLKDGNRLELEYGNLKGTLTPGEARARYDVNDRWNVEASKSGGEQRLMAGYKKEF